MNLATCPTCGQWISNVRVEYHAPTMLYGGSGSYTTVAFPCNHAIGAVPASWDNWFRILEKKLSDLDTQTSSIDYNVSAILNLLRRRQ